MKHPDLSSAPTRSTSLDMRPASLAPEVEAVCGIAATSHRPRRGRRHSSSRKSRSCYYRDCIGLFTFSGDRDSSRSSFVRSADYVETDRPNHDEISSSKVLRVRARGFEPPNCESRTRRDTRLHHALIVSRFLTWVLLAAVYSPSPHYHETCLNSKSIRSNDTWSPGRFSNLPYPHTCTFACIPK